MIDERFSRTALLIGEAGVERLRNSSVIIFGAGGVGSYLIEALARAGVGRLTVVDNDTVDITNINRQLFALSSTMGRYKAEVARERILDINPDCKAESHCTFVTPENLGSFDIRRYDAVADAVDNVTAKLAIAESCYTANIPLVSSMGTGNKTDPSKLKICDIYETTVCPLARVMRRELKKRSIPSLRVVFSAEIPKYDGRPPASISFVPSAAGLLIAAEIAATLLQGYNSVMST